MAYRKHSNKVWTAVLAVLLAIVIAGAAALVGFLSDGFKNWDKFKDEEQAEQTDETADGAVISDGVSHGIKLMSARAQFDEDPSAGGSSDTASTYVLTATVEPNYAANKAVDWSVAFVNASSEWATGKTVTDYVTVTPESDGALKATVKCLKAFGEQIKVTVTSRDNAEASASCLIDYKQKLAGGTLKINDTSYSYEDLFSAESVDFPIVSSGVKDFSITNSFTLSDYTIANEAEFFDDTFGFSIEPTSAVDDLKTYLEGLSDTQAIMARLMSFGGYSGRFIRSSLDGSSMSTLLPLVRMNFVAASNISPAFFDVVFTASDYVSSPDQRILTNRIKSYVMEHPDVSFFTLKGDPDAAAYSEEFAEISVPIYFDCSEMSLSVESVGISDGSVIF